MGDQITLKGDINEYVLSHIVRIFFTKIELWDIIIDRHGSLGTDKKRTNIKRASN